MTNDVNIDEPEVVDIDNQDDFEDEFFQRKPEKKEEKAEEDEDIDKDGEDDPTDPEEESEESEEEEEELEAKPKRNRTSAKERIQELATKAAESDRREQAALQRENALRAEFEALKATMDKQEAPKSLREQLPPEAPNPDAKGDDGEPIYALGEFDPKYIADLTRFTINEEMKTAKEKSDRETQAKAIQSAQEELAVEWNGKLDEFEKEVPEIRENIRDLADVFQNIEPSYGEYLATTIMMMPAGPQIMQYLSENIGEARQIVATGPSAATLALGSLGFMLQPSAKGEKKRNKVSDAPPPPEQGSRGSGGKFAVAPDTDDQEAFEREFYKKR